MVISFYPQLRLGIFLFKKESFIKEELQRANECYFKKCFQINAPQKKRNIAIVNDENYY